LKSSKEINASRSVIDLLGGLHKASKITFYWCDLRSLCLWISKRFLRFSN